MPRSLRLNPAGLHVSTNDRLLDGIVRVGWHNALIVTRDTQIPPRQDRHSALPQGRDKAGRLRVVGAEVKCVLDAIISSGATPFSTQLTNGVSMSN